MAELVVVWNPQESRPGYYKGSQPHRNHNQESPQYNHYYQELPQHPHYQESRYISAEDNRMSNGTDGSARAKKRRHEESVDIGYGDNRATGAGSSTQAPARLLREIVALEGRLSLRNSSDIADLMAITHRTWLLPSDSPPAEMMAAAGKWYSETVKNNPGHGLGMPDYHIWKALISWMAERATSEAHKALATTHLLPLVDLPAYRKLGVRVCLCTSTARENTKRLKLSVTPNLDSLVDVLAAELATVSGIEEKHGRAPRSGLERELSTKLDSLSHLAKKY